jgi:putative transposase
MPSRYMPIAGGVVYHVTNRARDGVTLFDSPRAYDAFAELIAETHLVKPIRVLALCVMPNHWHFVLWPEFDRELEAFVGRLSLTHAKRLHLWRGSTGSGPVYPQRYRASPVESDTSLYRVIRYVERNPCAAGLTTKPEAWRWSSASPACPIPLAPWPVPRPPDWRTYVGQAIETTELTQIRQCLKGMPLRRRGVAVGPSDW